MAALRSAETLPIEERVIPKRLVDGILLTILVGVEMAWLCAIVAAVWLVVR
jgi:hypothetical protein